MQGTVAPMIGGARRSAGATWAPRMSPSTQWAQVSTPCRSISRPSAATKRPLADPRLSRLANVGAGPGGALCADRDGGAAVQGGAGALGAGRYFLCNGLLVAEGGVCTGGGKMC